ncbi:MAG TPA: GNAT family N-acetyltransferase [bacterium]|nr:GNAT family N-acetyltransferase [bacterium]
MLSTLMQANDCRYRVQLAQNPEDIQRSQRLRYQVFVQEMGAQAQVDEHGLERDHYDAFCQHLLVIDQHNDQLVASTRILTRAHAQAAGGFYSENEFDLAMLTQLHGDVMEIGRTCVHPDHRNGSTIGVLWQGMASFMEQNRISHLFGSASIPMQDGGLAARHIMQELRGDFMSTHALRVTPKRELPQLDNSIKPRGKPRMPPLLKAYMRLGAQICGEPCWDPAFACADIFILLDVQKLQARYHRHFVQRNMPDSLADSAPLSHADQTSAAHAFIEAQPARHMA